MENLCFGLCSGRHWALKRRLLGLLAFGPMLVSTVTDAAGNPAESIVQPDTGAIALDAAAATVVGPNARLEGAGEKDIVWWTNANTSLRWTGANAQPGKYRVELTYSLFGNNNGNPLEITVAGQKVYATPKAGNGVNDYKTGDAGEVTISKAGSFDVTVKTLLKGQEYVINIRSILLRPADSATPALDISGSVKQSPDDSLTLTPDDVRIDGTNAVVMTTGNQGKHIGFWRDLGTSLVWMINVKNPGKFRVELDYALVESEQGAKLEISVGNEKLFVKPTAGKNWSDYKIGNAGDVTISKPGKLQVILRPVSKPHAVMADIRSVSLVPIALSTHAADIRDKPIKESSDGTLTLTAVNAEIDGDSGRLEGGDKKYIAWWNSQDRSIKWPIVIGKPTRFRVEMNYSLDKADSSEVQITVGGQQVTKVLADGAGLDSFKTESFGEIQLGDDDHLEVVLKSPKEFGTLVLHLQSVTLTPIGKNG